MLLLTITEFLSWTQLIVSSLSLFRVRLHLRKMQGGAFLGATNLVEDQPTDFVKRMAEGVLRRRCHSRRSRNLYRSRELCLRVHCQFVVGFMMAWLSEELLVSPPAE